MTEVAAADIAATYDCKTPGCPNAARSRVGRYSYCDDCRKRRGAEQNGGSTSVPKQGSGFEQSVKDLARLAKLADRRRVVATRRATEALKAKAEADEAERRFRDAARIVLGDREAA